MEGERRDEKRQKEAVTDSETICRVDRRGDRGQWTGVEMRTLRGKNNASLATEKVKTVETITKVKKKRNMKEEGETEYVCLRQKTILQIIAA